MPPIEAVTKIDKTNIEQFILLHLTTNKRSDIIKLFLGNMTTQNHMIRLAASVRVYAIHRSNITYKEISGIRVAEVKTIGVDHFTALVRYLWGGSWVGKAKNALERAQLVVLLIFVFYTYLSVCNSGKIRSNSGLVFGWLIEVLVASAAADNIFTRLWGESSHKSILGLTFWLCGLLYLQIVMAFSSRTLFRTMCDLTGDDAYGVHDKLQMRLVKFYVGLNNSVYNEQGVYSVSQFLRQSFPFRKLSEKRVYVPNPSLVLFVNIFGLAAMVCVGGFAMAMSLEAAHYEYHWRCAYQFFQKCALALVIDHLLQMLYLVGIIVIDMNRIELTDLLDGSTDSATNPILNWLLNKSAPLGLVPLKRSMRYRLGILFKRINRPGLRLFWFVWVPTLLYPTWLCNVLLGQTLFPKELVPILTAESITHTFDSLYYLEMLAIMLVIVAVSQVAIELTYTKRAKKEAALGITAKVSTESMELVDLSRGESKEFNCINLTAASSSDILKVMCNSSCSFLVSVDLNHQLLRWSPLGQSDRTPTRLNTVFKGKDNTDTAVEFWPVNRIEMSNDGSFIVLFNYRYGRLKCFDGNSLSYIWEVSLERIVGCKETKVSAACYRQRTVAGYLQRRLILQRRGQLARRDSTDSLISNSSITGDFPPPKAGELDEGVYQNREELLVVLESGHLVCIACKTPRARIYDFVRSAYGPTSKLKVRNLVMLRTSRVNDRFVCELSNRDILVLSALNNSWTYKKLPIIDDLWKHSNIPAVPLATIQNTHDNKQLFSLNLEKMSREASREPPESSLIIPINFVGMILKVTASTAELIDVLTGLILKTFGIKPFKPGSFRVLHSEPTHCKFCGCASFESFSLVYESLEERTLVVQTYTIETKKSKSYICLRVERDPREIRCLGLDAVVESQYWYEDIEKWEVTDLNVIIGVRKKGFQKTQTDSLRRRRLTIDEPKELAGFWEGLVIAALNGKVTEYSIPTIGTPNFSCTRANCIAKYGYKAVAIAFGDTVKILYLGGDELIESDLYYSGTFSATEPMLDPFEESSRRMNLLFIDKRRKMTERRFRVRV